MNLSLSLILIGILGFTILLIVYWSDKINNLVPAILIAIFFSIPMKFIINNFGYSVMIILFHYVLGLIATALINIIKENRKYTDYITPWKSILLSWILFTIIFSGITYLTISGTSYDFITWIMTPVFMSFVCIPASAFLKCLEPYLSSNAPNKLPLGEKPNTDSNIKDSLGKYIGLVLSMDRDPSTNPGQGSDRDPWEGSSRGSAVIRRPSQHIGPQTTTPASREITMGEAPPYEGKGKGREQIANQQLDIAKSKVGKAIQPSAKSALSELLPNSEAWSKPQFRAQMGGHVPYNIQPATDKKLVYKSTEEFLKMNRTYGARHCLDKGLQFEPFKAPILLSDGKQVNGAGFKYIRPNDELVDRPHSQYMDSDAYDRQWRARNPKTSYSPEYDLGPKVGLDPIDWGINIHKFFFYGSHNINVTKFLEKLDNLSLFDRILVEIVIKDKCGITIGQLNQSHINTLKHVFKDMSPKHQMYLYRYDISEVHQSLLNKYPNLDIMDLARHIATSALCRLHQLQQAELLYRDNIINGYLKYNYYMIYTSNTSAQYVKQIEKQIWDWEEKFAYCAQIEEQLVLNLDSISNQQLEGIDVIRYQFNWIKLEWEVILEDKNSN